MTTCQNCGNKEAFRTWMKVNGGKTEHGCDKCSNRRSYSKERNWKEIKEATGFEE